MVVPRELRLLKALIPLNKRALACPNISGHVDLRPNSRSNLLIHEGPLLAWIVEHPVRL